MNYRKKLLAALMSATVLGTPLTVHAQTHLADEDIATYKELSEFIHIKPDLLVSDVDLTTLPIYSFGKFDKDKLLTKIETYYGEMPQYKEYEENRPPNYRLEKANTNFQIQTYQNDYIGAEIALFDLNTTKYSEYGYPYSNLSNTLIDYYGNYQKDIPLVNQALDFMSLEEAEKAAQGFLTEVLDFYDIAFESKSITDDEMQTYIDYWNVNKLKETTPDFTEEVPGGYFGNVRPLLNNYPLLIGARSSEGSGPEQPIGYFISKEGLENLAAYEFIPVGEKGENYDKVITYEQVLDSVKQALKQEPSVKENYNYYIMDISPAYLATKLAPYKDGAYYPVWRVHYDLTSSSDSYDSPGFQFYINPVTSEVIY